MLEIFEKFKRVSFIISKQLIFILKNKLNKTEDVNVLNLINNGYTHIQKNFPEDIISEVSNKYSLKVNKESISDNIKLDEIEKKYIFSILKKLNIPKICEKYLGDNLFWEDAYFKYLGNKKSFESAWQPHHDCQLNRLKIYIWISKKNLKTHPLYYAKGTHTKIKSFLEYKDSRFPKINLKFEEIYGDTGDIIIFDTHGIHSNFKINQVERECFIFTVNPGSIFSKNR